MDLSSFKDLSLSKPVTTHESSALPQAANNGANNVTSFGDEQVLATSGKDEAGGGLNVVDVQKKLVEQVRSKAKLHFSQF